MAGIYLHIPFCKSKCPYCNFFSVASAKSSGLFIGALQKEISLRQKYLEGLEVETIYFGGGTPSLLKAGEVKTILDALYREFKISENPEITLEANPDDINGQILADWRNSGINRLSIGIQSFADADLKYLGRIHTGEQAVKSLKMGLDCGFTNLSADFIYGMPTLTDEAFANNLETVVKLGIPHISAYALTIEEKTAMDVMIRKNRILPPDEDKTVFQFRFLMHFLGSHHYEHYEISNFCLPGKYSRHNSSYWNGEHYLGLGPSAHSYNGVSRQWNASSIGQYASLVNSGKQHFEIEFLTPAQQYNEYVMTSLRTIGGAVVERITALFGAEAASFFTARAGSYLLSGHILRHDGVYTLSEEGKLFADKISSELFMDND